MVCPCPVKRARVVRKSKWKGRGIKDISVADRLYENRTECQICKVKENLCLDHCHETLMTRGILCQKCNKGLGLFNDDPSLLHKAIDYVTNPVI